MAEITIRRAAVLGAGVMGAKIAAHLANVGISTILLDIAPAGLTEEERRKGLAPDAPEVLNRIARLGWSKALKAQPPALFTEDLAARVTLGNFTQHMSRLREVDWVVEAVVENLDVKRSLLRQVEIHLGPRTVVSTNTSGIPVRQIADEFSPDFRRRFLGTHFFNPPRYMKLLEIIPTQDTDPHITEQMIRFSEGVLGKGVVVCKDTPNFIANRIGTYGMCVTLRAMLEAGLSVEEVDLLTGPLIGRPKSATFRTLDLVGVDTLAHVAQNLYENLPEDPEREVFRLPPIIRTMIDNGWLGEKSGQGFYRKERSAGGSRILSLDPKTLTYAPVTSPRPAPVEKAAKLPTSAKRLKRLISASNRLSRFLWNVTSSTLSYSARLIPEIADDITSVDRAMRWGFQHELGPFETWDALGVPFLVKRLEKEGRPVPPIVRELMGSGKRSLYRKRAGRIFHFVPSRQAYEREEERPDRLILSALKERKRVVFGNPSASLIDAGDGVACLEFHSKMNSIGGEVLEMIFRSVEEVEQHFLGLLIANEGEHFSVGANLVEILTAARMGRWDAIDQAIRTFQNATMRLRYSHKPVVGAPQRMALGGGCEIALHCDRIHASSELYIGFAETGVGLIPAAGGCKEMVARTTEEALSESDMELFPRIRNVFELIGMAKISTSAPHARQLRLLGDKDHITVNPDQRIALAKQDVIAMSREGYHPPLPRKEIPVLGEPGLASLKLGLHLMHRAGYISEYDKVVATKLAEVLTGGASLGMRMVSEQDLLDFEREAFLSLCGQAKTQERMEYMLRNGKPLRN